MTTTAIARICADRLLNSMLEGIAIGLFAWILLLLVGRRNSSTRFAVWFSALLAIATLPVLRGAGMAYSQSAPSAITLPGSWALVLFIAWAAIAGALLLRVAVGLLQLRKLRASCQPIEAETLDPLLRATLQNFQATRSVQLCQSSRLQVPTAIGFLRPAVVIPLWAIQELSAAELNSILIHELAHLQRGDDWTNLAQQVLRAILFFHPAVWWIGNKLALEREMACDDAVLAQTANPKGYAQCLVSIAEKSFMRRGLVMAQAAVNRIHQTTLRVSQILDVNRPRATRVWKPALYSVAAFFVVCLLSLSHAPELVAFQDQTASVANPVARTAARTSPVAMAVRASEAVTPPAKKALLIAAPGKSMLARRTRDSARPVQAKLDRFGPSKFARIQSASFTGSSRTPQTIFVVMQTEEYGQSGPILWKLSVWHVLVFDSNSVASEARTTTKQI